MEWWSIFQFGRRTAVSEAELVGEAELVNEEPFPYEDHDDFTFGLEEALITLVLLIVGYIVLATPCRPLRSIFAHIHIHPADWLDALWELRHVRSAADARFWWSQVKHAGERRRMHQQQCWNGFLNEYESDRTVRAGNNTQRNTISSAPLKSLFLPMTPGKKLHNSSSDGYLLSNSQKHDPCDNSSESDAEYRLETDHERFERAYKSYIRNCEYKRLVLPPECKRVDAPHIRKESEYKISHESAWRKTISYIQNLYAFYRKFFSVEGVRAFLLWIMHVIRYKLRKRRGLPVDEDEEDDDDDGSIVTFGGIGNSPKFTPKQSSKKPREMTSISEAYSKNENDPSVMNIPSLKQIENQDKSLNALNFHPRMRVDTGDDSTFVSAAGIEMSERSSSQITDTNIPLTVISKQKMMSPLPANLLYRSKQNNWKKNEGLDVKQAQDCPEIERISPMPSPKVKRHNHESANSLNFFDTANSNSELRDLTRAVPIPDANGFILGDEFISASCTPLLVFVNSRSGPQQGNFLIAQFKRLLNPIQVWDLGKGGPEKVLQSFSVLSRFQILICGGDGTVSWIISVLERMDLKRWPPIGILPLGTGNDLARVHGWGGGYSNESLLYILRQISDSYVSMLDLWELGISDKKGKQKGLKSFINYLGVGVDAQAALQVHNLRESTPKLFFSRFYNKVWYALAGGEEAIKSSCANLPKQITLVADGVEIPLPPDSQGVIFLNIDSYSGGVPLWSKGHKQRRTLRSHSEGDLEKSGFARSDSIDDILALETEANGLSYEERLARVTACDLPSSCQDGLLDVVSIRGTFHLGQIRVGLSNAQRLCQCKEAVVTLEKRIAVQIDGEPWRQNPSILRINRKNVRSTMLSRATDDSSGVESEVAKLLNWASEKDIIDRNQYTLLTEEFSRRIEKKKREKSKTGFPFG